MKTSGHTLLKYHGFVKEAIARHRERMIADLSSFPGEEKPPQFLTQLQKLQALSSLESKLKTEILRFNHTIVDGDGISLSQCLHELSAKKLELKAVKELKFSRRLLESRYSGKRDADAIYPELTVSEETLAGLQDELYREITFKLAPKVQELNSRTVELTLVTQEELDSI